MYCDQGVREVGTEELVAQKAQDTHLSPKERVAPIVDAIRGERLKGGSQQRNPVSTPAASLRYCKESIDPKKPKSTRPSSTCIAE
jgi:hypothetical protein